MTVLWLLFLGVGTQLVGTASARKQRTYLSSWHYIPMTYGVLGLALGHGRFTATTGLYSLAVGMLLLVISQRYLLRCLATLLIGLTAIFQAEIAAPMFIGLSLIISFGLIGFGLFRRVRAYLYIGTLTFMLQILRTIMIFIDTDGRMLWAVDILLGITLIWIAATFESRRTQIHSLLSQWSAILANWE